MLGYQGVGMYFSVVVTATNAYGEAASAVSNVLGPVGNPPPPQNTGLPTVSGQPVAGHYLEASSGTWTSPDLLSYAYQWFSCPTATTPTVSCAPVGSRRSYLLGPGDVGLYFTVTVTAEDKEQQTTAATATAVGPVRR